VELAWPISCARLGNYTVQFYRCTGAL